MQIENLAHDSKPQARIAGARLGCVLGPVETLKQVLKVFLGDTTTGIFKRHQDRTGFPDETDIDPAA